MVIKRHAFTNDSLGSGKTAATNIGQKLTNRPHSAIAQVIDIVDIATPTYLHAPMALAAVQAGKHVHCEKPFCRFVGEGLQVGKAAAKAGVRVVVGETYVFTSAHQQARALIEAGEIGRPLQIRQRHGDWIEREKARVYTGPPDRNWRVDAAKSVGGVGAAG